MAATVGLLLVVVAVAIRQFPRDGESSSQAEATAPATRPSSTQEADRTEKTDTRANTAHVEPARPPEATPPSASLPRISRSVDLLSEPIRQELAHVDPTKDGWDSEAFSESATAQCKRLGKALADWVAKPESSLSLTAIVVDSMQASSLAPSELREVFRDERLTIGRGATELPPTLQGRAEFLQALQTWLTPWKGSAELHTHFKITQVRAESDAVTTEVHVQVAGVTTSGRAQANAVWNCVWTPSAEPMLTSLQVANYEFVASKRSQQTLLADCTQAVLGNNRSFSKQLQFGIDYWRETLDWRLGLDVAGPHGLAIGDVDGDGLDDLFICEPGGLPNRLYVQQPDGTAVDRSALAGVHWLEPATSALFIDQDNDGDQDLLFTSGRYLLCCENDGTGIFSLRNVNSMTGVARSISAADYDGDGSLDIYVCCYIGRGVALDDVGLGKPMPYHDANNGPANYLFAYRGDWQYEDVTQASGLDQNNRRFSYAAAWEDYDNDGDLDLYVANDFGRNNLYQNRNGKFGNVAAEAGVEDISTGMSVSWGDYNRDGRLDLYVGNMFSSAGNRITYQRRFQTDTDDATRNLFRRLARGNSLFKNRADGTFEDVSLDMGVTLGRWAWGSMFADLNNDGWEDLLVGNGMITSKEDSGDL